MTPEHFDDDEFSQKIRFFKKFIKNKLWPNQKEIDSVQRFAQGYEDTLQSPLQPLMHHLESSTYEIFEKDPVKYEQYYLATVEAIKYKTKDGADGDIIIAVVGAGRGPIVSQVIRAAKDCETKIKLFAVEKNPSAIYILEQRNQIEWKHSGIGQLMTHND
jgi:protein arginine N-methyltransferase 5